MNSKEQAGSNSLLLGEEGWDSNTESSSTDDDDDNNKYESNESNRTVVKSKNKSSNNLLRVQVQRGEISSTTGQEGTEELQNLDVEIYDQQTYENGVFDQVNKAISKVDNQNNNNKTKNTDKTTSKQSISNSDLMRVIHAQNDNDTNNVDNYQICDSSEGGEHVLQLTRLERLNKTVIKQERIDPGYSDFQSTSSLPKIPKLAAQTSTSNNTVDDNLINQITSRKNDKINSQPSIDRVIGKPSIQVKQEKIDDYNQVDEDSTSSDNNSTHSEYAPHPNQLDTDDNESDDDQNIDYYTDSELEAGHSAVDSEEDEDKKRKEKEKMKLKDDGDLEWYRKRIKIYNREMAKLRLDNILDDGTEVRKHDEVFEIDDNFQIPKDMWDNLFEHQRTGVRWLWELHQLGTGGILGDEMGLGKTIQIIAFLTGLKTSTLHDSHKGYKGLGPTVLICPATVMHQWLIEFRKWWPPFRVAILHSTGTFTGNRKNLVSIINKTNGVLIVSYPGAVIYQDYLHNFDWHYAILDEGHKIRNPDAQVTLACKRFRTPHRIILSGSPVQNNLKELWSIFDFIYPGKLGTLPVFMEQFATPITQGGYSNASDIQVQIAYKCACVLRDTIKPFLLRRTKAEVNSKLKLPDRSEQVLFCKLTEKQRKLYEAYLSSPTIRDIKAGFCQIFVGLIQLRKICNHPDLFDSTECKNQIRQTQHPSTKKNLEFFSEDETYGHINKSGKMMVVDALLKLWKKQGHKVLLFTQSRQMIKIFAQYLNQLNYKYLSMDGSTSIGHRQTIIEQFNKEDDIFVFLLTTRVGGVGVNLIGANRIIIYDPDWNPSTDIQARERAWRIGQKRHVIIYRLLTAGTIEEKIYHRQVFKLYLTNKVLKNAKQKRFFKTNDLHELFTLGDSDKNIETKALFDDDLQINRESVEKARKKRKKEKKAKKKRKLEQSKVRNSENTDQSQRAVLSEEKLQALRDRAKQLSQFVVLQYGQTNPTEQRVHIKIEPGTEQEPQLQQIVNSSVKIKKEQVSTKQHVKYLVKQDIYKPATSDLDKSSSRYKKDDYILERLFKTSNISGALKHDIIESDSTEDFKVVESEAEKVARDAIKALRESRSMCLDSTSGMPNWTGRNGHINSQQRLIPKNKSRIKFLTKIGGASTSSSDVKEESLLSFIKKRNQSNPIPIARYSNGTLALQQVGLDDDSDNSRDKDFIGKSHGTGADSMANKMREFILFKSIRNGESQTDEILNFFKQNFTPDKTAIFKALLYKMCEFQRRGDKGFWILRSEFRDF